MTVVLAAIALASGAFADPPRILNSRTIVLAVDSDPASTLELHVSTDERKSWRRAACDALAGGTVAYRATADGLHDFYFVARNAHGVASPMPAAGCASHAQVLVDTLPPILQVREVLTSAGGAGSNHSAGGESAALSRELRIRVTVVDQNASNAGVRVFYRAAKSDRWLDGGTHAIRGGEVRWQAPVEIGDDLDLHIVARDLAGNTAGVELLDVRIERESPPAPAPAPIVKPSNGAPRGPALASDEQFDETRGGAAGAEGRPVAGDGGRKPAAPVRPKAVDALREQAARYMSEGRYALAAARLDEALRQSPNDADTLLDLADARFWSGEYDAAAKLFGRAHEANSQAVRPLEGLALLAATQQRYGEARERLEALVKLDPANAEFRIRLGDMRLRAGDARGARELWQAIVSDAKLSPGVRDKAQRRLAKF
ncbi:MAG: tetratricopeptide repeat protein [Phycisphaerae bacterium]|nr:tetratricopeptide repeat protein [Phycisphaerae bacterium]